MPGHRAQRALDRAHPFEDGLSYDYRNFLAQRLFGCYLAAVQVQMSRSAMRALQRSNKRQLIAAKIAELAADPAALSANVIKLRGRSEHRLRVQDWRIIFRIEDDVLFVDEIEPRGSIYEDRT